MTEYIEGSSSRTSQPRLALKAEHVVAAFHAFNACYVGSGRKEWNELREWHTPPNAPVAAYYRKLADICERAMARKLLSEEILREVEIARKYFNELLQAEIKLSAEGSTGAA